MQTIRNEQKHFLADLLDASVFDNAGHPIGKIVDLTLMLGDRLPRLPQIVIHLHDSGEKRLFRRDQIQEVSPGRLVLGSLPSEGALFEGIPDQVLVRSILDKQIVDMSDARVVRVNDLQIADWKGDFRLIGVDIGLRGLLRRLGWEGWVLPLLQKIRVPLEHDLIPWDLVESVPVNFSHLRLTVPSQKMREMHPADLADILDDLSVHEGLNLIRSLDPETAAETLAEAEDETSAQIISQMAPEKASDILEEMNPDDAADILQDLDENKAEEILQHMQADEAGDVRELLGHDEDTAGGMMSTGFATIFEDFTVDDALRHLRLLAPDLEIIYYLYVTDAKGVLKGVVSIRDLLVSGPSTPVASIVTDKLIFVQADTPKEEVASLISKYDLLAMPVLDEDGTIMGVVTIDDVIELLLDHMPKVWKRRALSS